MSTDASPIIKKRQQVFALMRQLQFGDIVDVQFINEGKVRIKCKLLGLDEANFLMLAIPRYAQQGHNDVLVEGMACIIRSIIEGEAGQCIAFRSVVSDIIKSPKHLVFVKYPSEIERFSLRKQQRVAIRIPATISHRSAISDKQVEHDLNFDGIILDLSAGGCRFKLEWPENYGPFLLENIFVYIRFPTQIENNLVVQGVVKSQSRDGLNHLAVGIKFEGKVELDGIFKQLALDL